MTYQIKVGSTYGTRKVLSIAGKRGKIVYYKTQCLQCKHISIMYSDSIGRKKDCEKCRLKNLKKVFNLTYQKSRERHKPE